MAKAVKTDEEILAEQQERHIAKHNEIDLMILRNRARAERMERINPRIQDEYVLTVEEVEDIEKDLPEEFSDEDIEKVMNKKNIDVAARKEVARAERKAFKKQIDEQAKADTAGSASDTEPVQPN